MPPVLQRWQFANTSVNVFLPPLWRPHHGVAGWCKELDLVWMTCSRREGGNLKSSWGTPADVCHQVHLANEMQGAASSITIPPAFRHAGKRDVSSSHLGELGHARHTAETRLFFPEAWHLVEKHLSIQFSGCFPTSVCLKANHLAGRLSLHFSPGRWAMSIQPWCTHGRPLGLLDGRLCLSQSCFEERYLECRNLVNIQLYGDRSWLKPARIENFLEISKLWQNPCAGIRDGLLIHLLLFSFWRPSSFAWRPASFERLPISVSPWIFFFFSVQCWF